jgi:hypothetical protein
VAVSFVSSQTVTGAVGNSISIPRPTSATTGDLIVANIQVFPSSATLAAPGGAGWFTLLPRLDNGVVTCSAMVFGRWDDGSAGPWVFDTTGASGWRSGDVQAWRGLLGSGSPGDGSPSTNTDAAGSSATQTVSAVTTTRANDLLLFFLIPSSPKTIVTPPSGFTDRSAASSEVWFWSLSQAAIASSGSVSVTMNAASPAFTALIPLFTEAAAAGGASNPRNLLLTGVG